VPAFFGRRVLAKTSGLNSVIRKCPPTSTRLSHNVLVSPLAFHELSNPGSSPDGSPIRSFSSSPRNCSEPTDLMDSRIVPNLFSASLGFFRNKFFEQYIINRYDAEFSQEAFAIGAKSALLVVSDILASDDLSPLLDNELVTQDAYAEIKANHGQMPSALRRRFRVREEEIRNAHVHRIGIIEDDIIGSKAVEIMMVFTICDMDNLSLSKNSSLLETAKEISKSVTLGNYRFYRDYSNKDNPSSWVLNVVNHFSL